MQKHPFCNVDLTSPRVHAGGDLAGDVMGGIELFFSMFPL